MFNYGSGRKNPMENVKFHKKKTQPDQSQPNTSHGSTDQVRICLKFSEKHVHACIVNEIKYFS